MILFPVLHFVSFIDRSGMKKSDLTKSNLTGLCTGIKGIDFIPVFTANPRYCLKSIPDPVPFGIIHLETESSVSPHPIADPCPDNIP